MLELASVRAHSRVASAIAAVSVAVVAGAVACAGSPDSSAVTEVVAPDYNQFKGANATPGSQAGVSRLLERRCGTLDCHGQIGRPLRIYGEYGLRYYDPTSDVMNQPGTAPTTELEYQANYQAVIGLQPELMTLVVNNVDPPESLLLLRKPLQLERHKGGAVFVEGDDAYTCLTTWLGGQADLTSCYNASQ